MILILDNLINNYLNILSCFIILLIPKLNKDNFFKLLIIDLFLNKIPYISFIIVILFYFNKLIYKIIYKTDVTVFLLCIINYFIFIIIMYFINQYNFTLIYFIKNNLFSIILNIFIYTMYIFFNEDMIKYK